MEKETFNTTTDIETNRPVLNEYYAETIATFAGITGTISQLLAMCPARNNLSQEKINDYTVKIINASEAYVAAEHKEMFDETLNRLELQAKYKIVEQTLTNETNINTNSQPETNSNLTATTISQVRLEDIYLKDQATNPAIVTPAANSISQIEPSKPDIEPRSVIVTNNYPAPAMAEQPSLEIVTTSQANPVDVRPKIALNQAKPNQPQAKPKETSLEIVTTSQAKLEKATNQYIPLESLKNDFSLNESLTEAESTPLDFLVTSIEPEIVTDSVILEEDLYEANPSIIETSNDIEVLVEKPKTKPLTLDQFTQALELIMSINQVYETTEDQIAQPIYNLLNEIFVNLQDQPELATTLNSQTKIIEQLCLIEDLSINEIDQPELYMAIIFNITTELELICVELAIQANFIDLVKVADYLIKQKTINSARAIANNLDLEQSGTREAKFSFKKLLYSFQDAQTLINQLLAQYVCQIVGVYP